MNTYCNNLTLYRYVSVATLIYVAIVGVVCWGIYRLLLYFGITIPEPARIIFWGSRLYRSHHSLCPSLRNTSYPNFLVGAYPLLSWVSDYALPRLTRKKKMPSPSASRKPVSARRLRHAPTE